MGKCNIDHSLEDVFKKYETQKDFLPSNIREGFMARLGSSRDQETLNQVFHLLKKYDLATEEERAARDCELESILLEKV
ncbi:hypothetical protein [Bacillus sp. B-jedd]|uniref:hypothetical protein n=1 Tax=Bacillus sp. B-jedd TaxID=1476857 RepID=UPI000515650E|nr:hypothetical protein [Bacillus sp. B-jedd]CEG27321.1 group-specific protein [Bacillus sp. B-jedd]